MRRFAAALALSATLLAAAPSRAEDANLVEARKALASEPAGIEFDWPESSVLDGG